MVIKELQEKRKEWNKILNKWYNKEITDLELIRYSIRMNSNNIREFCIERIKGIDKSKILPNYKEIALTFAYKESNINPFAVGDLDISYDFNLANQDRGSWGMFQFYTPIHKNWVNFIRLRLPDIAYQIEKFWDLYLSIYLGIPKDLSEEEKLFLTARRYNGSGEMAERYAKDWMRIYKDIKSGKIKL